MEEEILEEQQDFVINSAKTITTLTLEGENVVETVTNVKDSEDITVVKTKSRTVSQDEGCEMEVIVSEEKEGGSTETVECSKFEK